MKVAKQNKDANEMKELYEKYENTKAKGDDAEKEEKYTSEPRQMFLVDKSTIVISAIVLCLVAVICGWFFGGFVLVAPHIIALLVLVLLILFFAVTVWNFRAILLNIKKTDRTIEELRNELEQLKEKQAENVSDENSEMKN